MARIALVSKEDFAEICKATPEQKEKLFVAGAVWGHNLLNLTTAANENILVPLKVFTPSGTGLKPDFNDLRIIDCGHSVAFGSYEASKEFIWDEYNKTQTA